MIPSKVNRLGAFLIDYFIICIVVVLISFILGRSFMVKSNISLDEFNRWRELNYELTGFGLLLAIFKDIIKGKSIGKQIVGLRIKNLNAVEVPKPWRLLLRNLSLLIWPIDLIYFLISNQRIGDKIFKTAVIVDEKNNL